MTTTRKEIENGTFARNITNMFNGNPNEYLKGKIFTVRHSYHGESSVLNGKLVQCRISESSGRATFLDVLTRLESGIFNFILATSKVASCDKTPYGVNLITENGSIYELIDLNYIIPTTPDGRNRYEEEEAV